MARPHLHNTEEEKAEAACAYKRAYYARHCDKLCLQKKEIYKGKQDRLCGHGRPASVGQPCLHYTAEEKLEAACQSQKAYYDCNREEIHIKYQNKSNSKVLDNTSSLKPTWSVQDANNRRRNKWARLCDDIDTSLQAIIGSSSTVALVEGLCELFIAKPDEPDSLDVLWAAHNGLEDLLLHAQNIENNIIEECGTGQDLSCAHSSVSFICYDMLIDQLVFNATFEDEYLKCQKKGNYTTFWQPFFKKWEEQWPARASLFPAIPMDQALTAAQLEEEDQFKIALQKRLTVKFHDDYGNSRPSHKAAAAGNLAVHKLLCNIIKGPMTGRKCPLKEMEVYAKKYYATQVQASVKDELNAIKEQPNAPDPKKTNLQVVQKHVDRCWENESAEVKEEISQLTREMREAACEAAKGEKSSEVTNDLIIPRLTEILSTFFGELHKATGWTFSVLLGGPDPSNGGAIDVSSLHVGLTKLGNRFNHAFAKFNDNVMIPYYEFVSHVFPEAGTLNKAAESLEAQDLFCISTAPDEIPTNNSPTPMTTVPDTLHGSHTTSLQPELASILLSSHLEQEEVVPEPDEEHFFRNLPADEIDQELNMPILPMLEGYVPFCPPLLPPLILDPIPVPTAFLNLDSNLESFDDALKTMQSQKTITGMVCSPPCIHYQFDNFIRFSSPTVPASTTPTLAASSLATTPFTTPAITPSTTPMITHSPAVASSTTPNSGTTPTITPSTMPMIAHSPAVASSTTPNSGTTPTITPSTMPAITHSPVFVSSTTPSATPLPAAPTTIIPATTPSSAAPTTTTPAVTPSPGVLATPKKAPCACAGETDLPQAVPSDEPPAKHQKKARYTGDLSDTMQTLRAMWPPVHLDQDKCIIITQTLHATWPVPKGPVQHGCSPKACGRHVVHHATVAQECLEVQEGDSWCNSVQHPVALLGKIGGPECSTRFNE
ncbi:uncharacterized protein BJ212DRAFT_1303904 [Suillus subaureus]|uniref:Uncharacterized protein n=1 Tax=Suillus subaureus TaxID=48587 RepID=A0A9P7J705_9AGAM|nr:uncharacterized protein BJ212DRAFT_1303904 [Suillus subaureus]KAG1805843.1 hypothetical protein BJ212DRAFT_1303904 [Suillus subaureus]